METDLLTRYAVPCGATGSGGFSTVGALELIMNDGVVKVLEGRFKLCTRC